MTALSVDVSLLRHYIEILWVLTQNVWYPKATGRTLNRVWSQNTKSYTQNLHFSNEQSK